MKQGRSQGSGADPVGRGRDLRGWEGRGKGLLRLTTLVLAATALLLLWVAMGVVRASRDATVRNGLDYEHFLEAVDDLIQEAGDSALLAFDLRDADLGGGRTAQFDTLRILADTSAFPAFRRGGFLHEQVRAYNRFQRDRVELASLDPQWWDRMRGFNPSIFRSFRKPQGTLALTRAPEAWSLRIRSPLEGGWGGEVRAMDVVRDVGLLSPRVTVPLRKPASLLVPVGERDQLCEFVPDSPEIRVYCLSEERIAQAVLRLEPRDRDQGWARAGWADLWVDGERVASGDSSGIRAGSMLRLEPLDPVALGEYWEGVLSSQQWVNGRMRRRSDLPQPLDLFAGLGAAGNSGEGPEEAHGFVRVSVRAGATTDLTRRLEAFLESEVPLPLDFATAVVARIPDGEIVAVAEVGERRNRGRSALLERVAPGSAVKPLLASAILWKRPELASLTLPARSGPIYSVMGLPGVSARRAFNTSLNCAPPREGRVDLRYFLRCSNNEYAASLLVAGLTDAGGLGSSSSSVSGRAEAETPGSSSSPASGLDLQGTQVPRTVLLKSPLSQGISELFDLPTDPVIADRARRSRRVWEGLTYSDGTPFPVPRELLPSESRPALLAPGNPEGTDLSLLYRYAIGAWENQWTLLDLVNSFGRVVTDTRMQMGFAPRQSAPDLGGAGGGGHTRGGPGTGEPEGLGLGAHPWYAQLLSGLQAVSRDGTAAGLGAAWRQQGLPPSILAKTGTLSEAGEPTSRDDLFSKSLLFAIGEGRGGADGPLGCGLVGGIYFRFQRGPEGGSLPSYQVAFARQELGRFLQAYWEEFGACERGGG